MHACINVCTIYTHIYGKSLSVLLISFISTQHTAFAISKKKILSKNINKSESYVSNTVLVSEAAMAQGLIQHIPAHACARARAHTHTQR